MGLGITKSSIVQVPVVYVVNTPCRSALTKTYASARQKVGDDVVTGSARQKPFRGKTRKLR